jgi:LPXTG-site transpeptidase (sortase) family protein
MKRMLATSLVLVSVLMFAMFPAQADGESIIRIPDIGVEAPIVPVYIETLPGGTTWNVSGLRMNAGLFTGLGTFGQQTNTVIGAHSEATDGSPDLFYNLDSLQVDDAITIDANGQQFVYEVTDVYQVSINDLSPLYPTQDEQLTLITCARDSYDSATGEYSRRVVVVAVRVA